MSGYKRICLAEREEIYRLLQLGYKKTVIATALGRSDRAILGELKRCSGDALGYLPDRADAHANAKSSQRREVEFSIKQTQLEYVHERLKLDYSPEQIAGRMRLENSTLTICHESIYRLIFSEKGLALGLPKLLPRKHKKRKIRKERKSQNQPYPQCYFHS